MEKKGNREIIGGNCVWLSEFLWTCFVQPDKIFPLSRCTLFGLARLTVGRLTIPSFIPRVAPSTTLIDSQHRKSILYHLLCRLHRFFIKWGFCFGFCYMLWMMMMIRNKIILLIVNCKNIIVISKTQLSQLSQSEWVHSPQTSNFALVAIMPVFWFALSQFITTLSLSNVEMFNSYWTISKAFLASWATRL